MLTSESKRSVIAGCIKSGIDDYILKPFRPEELRGKVFKVLGVPAAAASPMPTASAPPAPEAAPAPSAAPAAIDVLVVDDMENVHRKLRSLLPAPLSLHGVTSAQAALQACRDKPCKVILLVPDVNSVALMNQMRALQAHAAIVAMPLRSAADAEKEAREAGYDGCMVKPFQADGVQDFLLKFFANQDVVTAEDNVLRVAAFSGKDERLERFYVKLGELLRGALEKVAAACHDEAILDLGQMPLSAERTARTLLEVDKQAKKLGLSLRLCGTPELGKLLTGFTDTAKMPFFPNVDAARSAA
jgi:DNA-binding response OmpR family regulator